MTFNKTEPLIQWCYLNIWNLDILKLKRNY